MNKALLITVAFCMFFNGIYAQDYTGSSVLDSGSWYKIKITDEAIYRLDYSSLISLGMNAGNEPAIYCNNFGLLSYYNDDPYPDDLRKTAIRVERGGNGIFDEGDYILFYGQPTHRWKYNYSNSEYEFHRHYYSDTAVYFLKLNDTPLEIQNIDDNLVPNNYSEESDLNFIHENEDENLLKSGREWYEPVPHSIDFSIDDPLKNYLPANDKKLKYRLRLLARSSDQSVIRFNNGSTLIKSISIPAVNIYNTAGTYAKSVTDTGSINIESGNTNLTFTFHNNGNYSARAWLDYIILSSRITNSYDASLKNFFKIQDTCTLGENKITRFKISYPTADLIIWDVTDPFCIKKVKTNFSAKAHEFVSETDTLKQFIAFSTEKALSPIISEYPLKNQNLHKEGTYDMIILTHPLFNKYANELAELHLEHDNYISKVVNIENIYNEFSGGISDISAIRNYIRMIYSRNKNSERPLKYILLFGDGSYENKINPPANPNYVPTYQTQNSHIKILSFTSDDYYGLLDYGEGEAEGYLDVGIGRLPVSDTLQAAIMLNKIRKYISPEAMGPWRNNICMVADDEDNNIHMNDADNLAMLIESLVPSFNIEKIYLDAYEQITSINGDSYPDATNAINNSINNGCLILSYAGHGNEIGLAHERVIKTEDISSWSNDGKYPVFITATCEFSRFEDINIDPGSGEITQKSSAGELVLLNPDGGAIALLTTTRIVFASHNYNLASNLYKNAFLRDSENKGLTLGEILRRAKINTGGDNKRNFTLLGDPAIRLAYPWYGEVVTDSINGKLISEFNDTINALSMIRISGHLTDYKGHKMDSFNGYVYPSIYDKEYESSTLANDGGSPFVYSQRNRVLFRGKAEVINGYFSTSMLIPRDIDYAYGQGKINYYAKADTRDYSGYSYDVLIGGFNNIQYTDTSGPLIKLYMNDTLFRPGGITDTNPVLLAHLSDPGSINTTGTGIGHDIIAVIDNNTSNSIVLNNYYESDLGTYKSGKLSYPLPSLNGGEHLITLKAWDNFNNSSLESLIFLVRSDEDFILNKLINYPNPFIDLTHINVEHNRPDAEIEIIINIFSTRGALVKTIKETQITPGYNLNPIKWDGRSNNGSKLADGIYIYTVIIKTDKNELSRISGRMIIL